jgi:outer membrane protein OmpA-like peptidoglycan-associated protein
MEQRFGHDFSRVRVHSGDAAEQSAEDVNAQAYTVGHNVVFGAGRFAPATLEGRRLIAHELAHVLQQSGSEGSRIGQTNKEHGLTPIARAPNIVQRKCHETELGPASPDCTLSQQDPPAGWQLLFKAGCDDLLPGQEKMIDKLRPGNSVKIHGFASRDGKASFNEDLSCHRANRIADMVRAQRADCPVIGIFKHGESPLSGPGALPDVQPASFWRSVSIEEVKPAPESGEFWLDPTRVINQGWALHARAQHNPTPANLDTVAARRLQLQFWLQEIPMDVAPKNAKLTRQNLADYRRFSASAVSLWVAIDKLLAINKHAAATKDTYLDWTAPSGSGKSRQIHAQDVPGGAKYHIDIFGEGYFPGAVNIGMATRVSANSGVANTPVPNLIYRRFSSKDANQIPIADHTADLITSESGPIGYPGLAEEIARIIAPGGTIVLFNPASEEVNHDKVAKLTGGTVTKIKEDRTIETKIVVPGP